MKRLLIITLSLFALALPLPAQEQDVLMALYSYLEDPLTLPDNDLFRVERRDCKATDGKNIYGVAFIPKGKPGQKFPTVIASHGFSSRHVAFSQYGKALAAEGIALYAFDFCGGSMRSQSEGSVADMSVVTEKEDLMAVFSEVRGWDFVDRKNIFLCGESQGGFVTAFAGAELQKRIRAMILLYPALHIPVAMERAFPDYQHITDEDIASCAAFGEMKVSRRYPLDAIAQDSGKICRAFRKDVLIIHGDADEAVDLTYSFQALKDFPHATLKIIPGAPHVFFFPEHYRLATDYMLEFLKKEIR